MKTAASLDFRQQATGYPRDSETALAWYLLLATAVFAAVTLLAYLLPKERPLPPMVQVELGVEAVENEPPPLGEVIAGAGQIQPEAQPTPPEVTPPPEPVPEPPPPDTPAPEQPPVFVVPEDKPIATPRPKAPPSTPAPHAKPKPAVARTAPRPGPAPTANTGSETDGEIGTRGSPTGQAGGRGGSRGDFVNTPHPQYDDLSRQRRYQGHGVFVIRYVEGKIVSVGVAQSTGVPYLDSRTTAWISSRWQVKAGVSGTASLPVTWQLQ